MRQIRASQDHYTTIILFLGRPGTFWITKLQPVALSITV
jgi:hypothetical protein